MTSLLAENVEQEGESERNVSVQCNFISFSMPWIAACLIVVTECLRQEKALCVFQQCVCFQLKWFQFGGSNLKAPMANKFSYKPQGQTKKFLLRGSTSKDITENRSSLRNQYVGGINGSFLKLKALVRFHKLVSQ